MGRLGTGQIILKKHSSLTSASRAKGQHWLCVVTSQEHLNDL